MVEENWNACSEAAVQFSIVTSVYQTRNDGSVRFSQLQLLRLYVSWRKDTIMTIWVLLRESFGGRSHHSLIHLVSFVHSLTDQLFWYKKCSYPVFGWDKSLKESNHLQGKLWFSEPKYLQRSTPAGKYMFKVNNRNTQWRQWLRSGVFIVNFEHISHLILVFLLLTLSK